MFRMSSSPRINPLPEELIAKNRKVDGSVKERQPTQNKMQTKITDLNEDCLYSLFRYLNLQDALNLASLSRRFIAPANLAKKPRTELVEFFYGRFIEKQMHLNLLPFIGRFIDRLTIEFRSVPQYQVKRLEDSILKHCCDLQELKLLNCRDKPFESIDKELVKLKAITIKAGTLGPNFSQFAKWCPNLQKLTLDCYIDSEFVMENLTTITWLQHLSLHLTKNHKTPCNVDRILLANKRAQSVDLNFGKINFFFF